MLDQVVVKRITSQEVHPLRKELLRPNLAVNQCSFEGDQDQNSFHLGIVEGQNLFGIASFMDQDTPFLSNRKTYRLRGMAIKKEHQGKGLGRQLVIKGLSILNAREVDWLWFNAREGALGFYGKLGFVIRSDKFNIEGAGPHFLMAGKVHALLKTSL